MRRTSGIGQAFTLDTFDSNCAGCGQEIRYTRRGPIALILKGHRCIARTIQEDTLRTVKAIESVGVRVTPREVARDLDIGRQKLRERTAA